MTDAPLYIYQHLPGVGLIPTPVQVLGRDAKLNDQIAREVLRLVSPLFSRQRWRRARSSLPTMMWASDPPTK